MMVPLIYSANYNISAFGLERMHPFDSVKYRRIHDWLISQGLRREADFVTPAPCKPDDLLRVHTPGYLRSLKGSPELARILEVWIIALLPAWFVEWRVLRPMCWATGGTVRAGQLARAHGLAINLGGGFHHAGPDSSSGFCVYADVPLALAMMHEEKPFRSALVIDTDVHQGDGTARALHDWPWAHTLDFYEQAIFPRPKAAEDFPVPLPSDLVGDVYLELLQTTLPQALDRFAPDFVFYNAGSDVLETDPLSSLRLTPPEMCERDLYVVTQVRERGIPLAMVLSGGYGPLSWEAHARSIEGILTRFDVRA